MHLPPQRLKLYFAEANLSLACHSLAALLDAKLQANLYSCLFSLRSRQSVAPLAQPAVTALQISLSKLVSIVKRRAVWPALDSGFRAIFFKVSLVALVQSANREEASAQKQECDHRLQNRRLKKRYRRLQAEVWNFISDTKQEVERQQAKMIIRYAR